MAEAATKDKAAVGGTTRLRARWASAIIRAEKQFQELHTGGDRITDQYRIEKKVTVQQDKYNILYSNTETIKPSLYSQTPKAEVRKSHTDQSSQTPLLASLLMEASIDYIVREQDFDDCMNSVVEDFLLPGLANVWLRYEPTFKPTGRVDEMTGKTAVDENGDPETEVSYEFVAVDYVFWKDWLCGKGRSWGELPWVARSAFMDRSKFSKRFGKDKAARTQFSISTRTSGMSSSTQDSIDGQQARVWEIWDKRTRKVIWFCPTYPDDVLEVADDFLHLKDFFPCPRSLRAVKTNNTFTPRPLYAQYQAQADELNDITHRIRRLVDALRVIGIYDASAPSLKELLTGQGNKMVPVENWAMMQEKGGLKGSVDFLPLSDIILALMQLYDAREKVKAEIYEITGWSDIIRGTSKASETLGAQKIKENWAGARLKYMQREVQRFCRDVFRMIGEIVAEHFQEPMLTLISGMDITPELQPTWEAVLKLLRSQQMRCTSINVETDSTILPDEANDRQERMQFLASAGAYLQQAVPAMAADPRLGPLLGSILMFTVRSFPSARALEGEFEKFTQSLEQQGTQPPAQKGKEGGDGGAQSRLQATAMQVQAKAQTDKADLAEDQRQHNEQMRLDLLKEQNRHSEKERELAIREREAAIKERELGMRVQTAEADRNMADVHHQEQLDQSDADRAQAQTELAANVEQQEADRSMPPPPVDS